MHRFAPLLAPLALASGLLAQVPVTSPRGLDTVEGNQVFFHFGGSRRFQQVDYTQAGTPMVISTIGWRRNGNVTQTAPTRTLTLSIDMGHTNFGVLSHYLDDNFTVSRANMLNQASVQFPDWSAAMTGPAPFDFQVPLAAPFVYNGSDALVIDFTYTASVSGTVQVDREFNGPTTPPAGAVLGTGCIATGMASAFAHTMYMADQNSVPTPAYGLRLRLGGTNAPATSPVFVFIDYQNENLSGLLCSTVYALPVVMLTMISNASGAIPDVNYMFPYDPSLIGGTFVTQMAAVDFGQAIPVVVSNGRSITLAATAVTNQHRCSYGWYTVPSTLGTATHFVGGGMVLQLQ